jgi:hypothetical protein
MNIRSAHNLPKPPARNAAASGLAFNPAIVRALICNIVMQHHPVATSENYRTPLNWDRFRRIQRRLEAVAPGNRLPMPSAAMVEALLDHHVVSPFLLSTMS